MPRKLVECSSLKLSGMVLGSWLFRCSCLSKGVGQDTSRGPCQPQPGYDCVKSPSCCGLERDGLWGVKLRQVLLSCQEGGM